MKVRSKILVKHSRKCVAVEAVAKREWDTPWCLLGQIWQGERGYSYRDKIGRKSHAGYLGETWLRAVCNDPDCSARLIVHEGDLLSIISNHTTPTRKKGGLA